ncbi:MAG TPA: helix-turn-helix transcriptional regulator [Kofleriaceae bacterium]|nr:helix-turn-helix transcriptional regulator [Kofleriaceae bacterium]
MSTQFDPISLLEEVYRPAADASQWLRRHAQHIVQSLDEDGFGAISYFIRDDGYVPTSVSYQPGGNDIGEAAALASLSAGVAALSPAQIEHLRLVMQQPGAHGFIETLGEITADAREPLAHADSIADSPAIVIPTGEHVVAIVATLTRRVAAFSRSDRKLWERLSIHLGAACRLSGRAATTDAEDVEAVLATNGRVIDARGPAAATQARTVLRQGVLGIERGRTRRGRADPYAALELWRGLYAGRWSLVEHVDTDGHRFVLARRNDPDRRAPFALTRRQRQVLFYASVGWSYKQIAYALGLSSEGSVSIHLSKSLRKIGLSTRADLIRVTSQWAAAVAGASAPSPSERELTPAEREVAEHVFAGRSNREIAEQRGVSERTIANQLASIYRKLELLDRHELVRWMSSRMA